MWNAFFGNRIFSEVFFNPRLTQPVKRINSSGSAHSPRKNCGRPGLRPVLPTRCKKELELFSPSIWITWSSSPISIPNSNVDVLIIALIEDSVSFLIESSASSLNRLLIEEWCVLTFMGNGSLLLRFRSLILDAVSSVEDRERSKTIDFFWILLLCMVRPKVIY